MLDLFILENNEVIVDPNLRESNAIMRDLFSLKYNKCDGDHDGRKRTKARKLLRYVWLRYSWRSSICSLSAKKREEYAVNDSRVDWNIDSDDLAQDFIKWFIDMQNSNLRIKACVTFRNMLIRMLDAIDDLDFKETDEFGNLIHDMNKYMKMGTSIRNTLADLTTIEEEAKLVLSEQIRAKGGSKIGNRENPR